MGNYYLTKKDSWETGTYQQLASPLWAGASFPPGWYFSSNSYAEMKSVHGDMMGDDERTWFVVEGYEDILYGAGFPRNRIIVIPKSIYGGEQHIVNYYSSSDAYFRIGFIFNEQNQSWTISTNLLASGGIACSMPSQPFKYTGGVYHDAEVCGMIIINPDSTGLQIRWNGIITDGSPVQEWKKFFAAEPLLDTFDPFTPAGTSGDDTTKGIGGWGNFNAKSDKINKPGAPQLTASATGFVTLYNPTLAQLQNLASYMWAGLFDLEHWRKIFADPMDAILGLSIVPVAVPSSGGGIVNVGNIPTGIYMNYASSQFITVDCGSVLVEEYWGSYLDYSPYTKAEIYLPYIGIRPVSVDDIMGKQVNVSYTVDILSGACVCFVKCGEAILYTYAGQCSTSIPVTSNSFASIVQGALHIAGAVGSLVATGGMSAPIVAGDVASIASTTSNMKPDIERSGSIGGSAGLMGIQKPYLIITRPKQCLPKNQNSYTGYPCFVTKTLSTLKGYTVVDTIHLENIPCTENEQAEIEALLKSGVII